MKSFDEWFEEKYLSLSIHANAGFEKDLEVKNIAKSAFTAGQQSKQAKVDESQKRIDEAIAILSSKKKMYVDMVIEVEKALKGGNK